MYPYETLKNSDTKTLAKGSFVFIILLNLVFVNTIFAIPQDTIKIVAKDSSAEAPSVYQINFKISKPISPKAVIKVQFPSSFDLSGLLVAGSGSITGGFEMTKENHLVILKRTGLGKEIKANESVDVKFAIVINPEKAGENYSIQVEVFDDNNKSIIQKKEFVNILPPKK